MSAFSWVKFSCHCPKCGKKLEGGDTFQTHDCEVMQKYYMCEIPLAEANYWHAKCDGCEAWLEFRRHGEHVIVQYRALELPPGPPLTPEQSAALDKALKDAYQGPIRDQLQMAGIFEGAFDWMRKPKRKQP